jgi:glycosyltransferase involved in cell wall biosynthesis
MREPFVRPGGLHTYVRGLADGQEAIGLVPIVIDNVTSRGHYSVARGSLALAADALQSPDTTIHYHFAHSAWPFLYRTRPPWSHCKRVFHFHGPWFREGAVQGDPKRRRFAKFVIEALVYRRFEQFFTTSNSFRERLAHDFKIAPSRISTVHPGVDSRRFNTNDSRAVARRKLGIATDAALVVSVRRLEPRMGLDLAIRAIASMAGVELAIAGDGSERPALENLAEKLCIRDRVHFLGRVSGEQLPSVYRAGNVSVVPTRALEGFGMVVLESMASGTPVVATRVDGLAEALGPFASEWTTTPDSVQDITDKLRLAISDTSLSASARSYAIGQTNDKMASNIEHVLDTRTSARRISLRRRTL